MHKVICTDHLCKEILFQLCKFLFFEQNWQCLRCLQWSHYGKGKLNPVSCSWNKTSLKRSPSLIVDLRSPEVVDTSRVKAETHVYFPFVRADVPSFRSDDLLLVGAASQASSSCVSAPSCSYQKQMLSICPMDYGFAHHQPSGPGHECCMKWNTCRRWLKKLP